MKKILKKNTDLTQASPDPITRRPSRSVQGHEYFGSNNFRITGLSTRMGSHDLFQGLIGPWWALLLSPKDRVSLVTNGLALSPLPTTYWSFSIGVTGEVEPLRAHKYRRGFCFLRGMAVARGTLRFP